MAKKQKHPEHVNHERWLISYADFITLLFAFFVVMFAVSQVDSKKAGRFQDSFSLAVGLSTDKGYLPRQENDSSPFQASMMPLRELYENMPNKDGPNFEKPKFPAELADIQRILEAKQEALQSMNGVKIIRRGNELVLRLDATALFDSGDDKIKPDAIQSLDVITEQVKDRNVQVRVEGHTDDVPIKTLRFRSNWDLSTARATSVVQVLAKRSQIDPKRFAAIGYGEFRPIAPNDGAVNRAKNRRVDFVVSVSMPEEPEVEQVLQNSPQSPTPEVHLDSAAPAAPAEPPAPAPEHGSEPAAPEHGAEHGSEPAAPAHGESDHGESGHGDSGHSDSEHGGH